MAESGSLSGPDGAFRAAYGAGEGWQDSLQACLDALATPPEGANLGLIYTTDVLADHLGEIQSPVVVLLGAVFKPGDFTRLPEPDETERIVTEHERLFSQSG